MRDGATPGRRIECFLSVGSPWAYLGHAEFMRIARRHGASVVFVPVPLRRLFPETGGLPLPKRHPVRQRYRLVELQRWRALRGLPLNLEPKGAPLDPEPLDKDFVRRYYTALGYRGEGDPSELPNEVRVGAAKRYVEAFERITGETFVPNTEPPLPRIAKNLGVSV